MHFISICPNGTQKVNQIGMRHVGAMQAGSMGLCRSPMIPMSVPWCLWTFLLENAKGKTKVAHGCDSIWDTILTFTSM